MFNSVVLDVFIGLIFIYLLYSLLATILQEIISRKLTLRARNLLKAVRIMLEDTSTESSKLKMFLMDFAIWKKYTSKGAAVDTFSKAFYLHPTIKYLGENGLKSKPSYIHPENFSQTVIQLLRGDKYDGTIPQMDMIYETLFNQKGVLTLDDSKVTIDKETLKHLQQMYLDAQKDLDRFRALLEDWFNETMDRAMGWFKKKVQLILFGLGFIMAVIFNVDTIAIYKLLAKDKGARDQMVQLAITSNKQTDSLTKLMRPVRYVQYKYDSVTKKTDSTVVTKDTSYAPLSNISDSALKMAFTSVKDDIGKANSTAGIGWTYNDSCDKYDDFFGARKDSLEARKQLLSREIDSVKGLKDRSAAKVDSVAFLLTAAKNVTQSDSLALLASQQKFHHGNWFVGGVNQKNWYLTLLGWWITALAISLGAPFWFDMLNKVVQLRGTGPKPSDKNSNDNAPGNNRASSTSTVNRAG